MSLQNHPSNDAISRRTVLTAATGLAAATWTRPVAAQQSRPTEPLAVVELFTSQGCNSCPPADRVMTDLVRRHEEEDFPALGLSFHVDYWNYLGWKDPFSSPRWSARQRSYSKVLQDRVYTPQMLVDGRKGFVGSRRRELEFHLAKQRKVTPQHRIALTSEASPQDITVSYQIEGNLNGMVLNVALVSRTMTSDIRRGENAGKKLTYSNVVRQFKTVPLAATGKLSLAIPGDNTKLGVIAYVQNIKSAEITGAAES